MLLPCTFIWVIKLSSFELCPNLHILELGQYIRTRSLFTTLPIHLPTLAGSGTQSSPMRLTFAPVYVLSLPLSLSVIYYLLNIKGLRSSLGLLIHPIPYLLSYLSLLERPWQATKAAACTG